jgi:ATP-binding cassette subfamily F protein 3
VAPFDGDLDDYQRYLLDEAKRQREAIKEATSAAAKAERKAQAAAAAAPKVKVNSSGLKRKLEDIEARMAVLNGEGASLEGHLSSSGHPTEIAEFGKRLKKVNDELQTLEEQWLAVSSELEAQLG